MLASYQVGVGIRKILRIHGQVDHEVEMVVPGVPLLLSKLRMSLPSIASSQIYKSVKSNTSLQIHDYESITLGYCY